MTIEAIASAVYNNVVGGLTGISSNPKISLEQLQDECVAEKNHILREYLLKGIMNFEEMFLSINCVELNCNYLSKCCDLQIGDKALHFEIPPILQIPGANTIKFIGSIDRKHKFMVYTDESYRYHQYRKRGSNKPYVYVDTAVNANGNIDCYVFNAPMAKYLSVTALFQDPRRLLEWSCCATDSDVYLDCGLISTEIIKRMTEKYLRYYRQLASPVLPNDQMPK